MIFSVVRRSILFAAVLLIFRANLFAQEPFQFPTANHSLYEIGNELKFFAPTAPDKPWTSGSFGCVRDNGTRMHEGLDIRHLQTDRRGEPTDPVMATADGTVAYFSKKPGLSNYGNYVVIRHVVEGLEIYSLYAHLSVIRPDLKIGAAVKAGEVIATMGRTSNAEVITKDRAHVHFELNVLVNDNIRAAIWVKFVNSLCWNPVAMLTQGTLGAIRDAANLVPTLRTMMREADALAAAMGLDVGPDPDKRIALTLSAPHHKMSMLQDLERGRPMEIDPLVSVVQEMGRLTQTPTPALDAVLALVVQRAKMAGLCAPEAPHTLNEAVFA